MRATVAIPTYNRIEIFFKTLPYWENQTVKDFEIIVIDDNSTDGTYEIIKNYRGNLKINVIKNNVNKGSADGRNKGALFANSDVIIYTDDDTFPTPEFIEIHLQYHEKYRNAIVRGPIINFNDLKFLDFFFLKIVF